VSLQFTLLAELVD